MELKRCERCEALGGSLGADHFECPTCEGIGWIVPVSVAKRPTTYGPGSRGKACVLAARYRCGLPLWLDDDEPVSAAEKTLGGHHWSK